MKKNKWGQKAWLFVLTLMFGVINVEASDKNSSHVIYMYGDEGAGPFNEILLQGMKHEERRGGQLRPPFYGMKESEQDGYKFREACKYRKERQSDVPNGVQDFLYFEKKGNGLIFFVRSGECRYNKYHYEEAVFEIGANYLGGGVYKVSLFPFEEDKKKGKIKYLKIFFDNYADNINSWILDFFSKISFVDQDRAYHYQEGLTNAEDIRSYNVGRDVISNCYGADNRRVVLSRVRNHKVDSWAPSYMGWNERKIECKDMARRENLVIERENREKIKKEEEAARIKEAARINAEKEKMANLKNKKAEKEKAIREMEIAEAKARKEKLNNMKLKLASDGVPFLMENCTEKGFYSDFIGMRVLLAGEAGIKKVSDAPLVYKDVKNFNCPVIRVYDGLEIKYGGSSPLYGVIEKISDFGIEIKKE